MSTSSPPQIYTHNLSSSKNPKASETIIKNALDTLRPHLPACIPLYRRLQFGRFYEATTLLTSLKGLETADPDVEDDGEWIIAFVDRTCRPETEVWIFGSWEVVGDGDDEDEEEESPAAIPTAANGAENSDENARAQSPDFTDAMHKAQGLKDECERRKPPKVWAQFLHILHKYTTQGTPREQVWKEVKTLLKGHPDLMQEFEQFCPPRPEITAAGGGASTTEEVQQRPPAKKRRIATADAGDDQHRYALLLSLLRVIRSLGPLPTSIHQDLLDATAALQQEDAKSNEKDVSGVSRKDYTAHLLNPDLILCGAVHETTTRILERNGLIKKVFDAGLVPNHCYVFDMDKVPRAKGLPKGLKWGQLKYEHFAIVRARTQIPRQDRTLVELPQLAIFDGETPVAWVFVGLDGSLTTLHVEEEYRGKGLAKAISTKLWEEKMKIFWEEGIPKYAHDYVIQGNKASVAVSESMGGKHIGSVFWIRLDMGLCD